MNEFVFTPKLCNFVPDAFKTIKFQVLYRNRFINPDIDKFSPPHVHNYVELLLNVSGEKSFWVNNKLYKINEGDVIVSIPNEVHVCVFEKPMIQSYFCLWIDSDDNDEIVKIFNNKNDSRLFSFHDDKNKIFNLFYSLTEDNNSEVTKTLLLSQILSLFINNSEYISDKIISTPPILSDITAFINKNFINIRKISDVADNFYISVPTLNRLFLKYIHTSPHKYIETKKLAFAANLLSSGLSVYQTCEKAGFNDEANFIVKFKKRFGITPLKYKIQLN